MNGEIRAAGVTNKPNTDVVQADAEGTHHFRLIPKEILCHILDHLTVYDCGRLSFTDKNMRKMFFSVALKPISQGNLNNMVAAYEANLGVLFLLSAKAKEMFWGQKDQLIKTEEDQFNRLDERKKIKYLICTEQGQAYLKGKNWYLIKSKIANATVTEEDILISKDEVEKTIQDRLKDPLLSDSARLNLSSKNVQACLFVGVLSFSEAEGLSPWARASMELEQVWSHLQEGLGNNTISKDDLLNLSKETFRILKSTQCNTALTKKYLTIKEVIQSPLQVELLINPGVISRLVQSGRRTPSEVLQWDKNSAEMKVLKLNWIWDSTEGAIRDRLHDSAKLIDQILSRAQLLCDIDDKCRITHGTPKRPAIENYLIDVWENQLAIEHCLEADPDALRTVLLLELDGEIAPLVKGGWISSAELLKLKPDQIMVLANKKVQWALEKGHLISWKMSRLSAEVILDSAISLYSENSHPEKGCITQ